MKKINRLQEIERVFGPEFLVKYFFCKDWNEIQEAIKHFESNGEEWGMRTDFNRGLFPGMYCPFLFKGEQEKAKIIWEENKEKLYYLVSERIDTVLCQCVALLLDKEHIFIEFNDKEPHISQREMYNHPENLRNFAVGPASYTLYDNNLIKSFHPEQVADYGFNKIYFPIIQNKIKETTFTVKPNKKIIIW